MARLYELTYLLNPALSEDEAQNFRVSLEAKIGELGGFVKISAKPAKTALAYETKKQRSAWTGSLIFETENAPGEQLEPFLKNQQTILRFSIFHMKAMPAPPEKRRVFSFKAATGETAVKLPEKPSDAALPGAESQPKEPKVDMAEIEKKLEELL